MTDLEGKAAIVTGGGTGLGAATARGLAARGANVVVNYSRSAEAAEATAAACREAGVEAVAVQADVAVDADCRRLVDDAVRAFGRLDILINNAGITKPADQTDLDALTPEDFERLYRVNLIAPYLMTRAARSALEASGVGSVVMVSSVAGVTGVGSSTAYAATKGALNTMTLSLARSLAPKIRVNAVCPGFIESGWFTKWNGAETEKFLSDVMKEQTPLKAASRPEDIAGTILFLASPQSAHMTGEHLLIDAGMHLGYAPLKAR